MTHVIVVDGDTPEGDLAEWLYDHAPSAAAYDEVRSLLDRLVTMPPPITSDRLAERLRYRRKALGFTLKDVAERSGLSMQYISNLEHGRGNPTLSTLNALREVGL
jgi:DNA-binding XRE family transcriptional regulator